MINVVLASIIFRTYAAWVTGQLSTHQTALVAVVLLLAQLKVSIWGAVVVGVAFVVARQQGHLDVEPVDTTPEFFATMAAFAVGGVGTLAVAPRALPLILTAGSAYMTHDAAQLLGMIT